MFNIHRYLGCYETLQLWTEKDKNASYYKENMQILKRMLPISDSIEPSNTLTDSTFHYSRLLFHSLKEIVSNIDLDSLDTSKEEMISVNNVNLIVKIIEEGLNYGLNPYLPEYFITGMRVVCPFSEKIDENVRLSQLEASARSFLEIIRCRRLFAHSGLESGILKLLFCHFYLSSKGIEILLQNELSDVFSNKSLLFEQLMLLKGLPGVPKELGILLHKALLTQLKTKGGFETFSRIVMAKSANQESWKTNEIISRIVAARGHTKEFYVILLDQIFDCLRFSVQLKDSEKMILLCVTCLHKYCDISKELCQIIDEKLTKWLEKLIKPPETLTGTILMSGTEYYEALRQLNICFGGSTIVSLPSSMIVRYHKTLFVLYCVSEERERSLSSPILNHIYKNREISELESMIKSLLFEKNSENSLFERIAFKKDLDAPESAPMIVICGQEEVSHIDIGPNFSEFFIQTGNMLLLTDIFMILLSFLGEEMSKSEKDETKGDLLFDDDDQIGEILSSKFMYRLVLMEVLQNFIACKTFQSHICKDPKKLWEFIREMLLNEFDLGLKTSKKKSGTETTMILMTIFKELLLSVQNKEIETEMRDILKKIEKSNTNSEIKQHLTSLFTNPERKMSESKYETAISLVNEPEVHLKVYGIQQLIALLNEKDKETVTNKHVILVLALKTLKINESYVYLNAIRLLLALTNVMEAEVIDTLIAEFENRHLDVDFRMKIGETTVKIAEALGPITFKYKKELVNCFLRGCVNERDEIRSSSFSNVGTLCKILTYQVTNFFQEILLIIHQTLQTDTYLPVRRSAVLVLSQFLQGMEKLIDYQEFLLPVYRTLKYVIQTENDEVTRIHAALCIETLNQKTKEMLIGEMMATPQIELRVKNVSETKKFDVKYK